MKINISAIMESADAAQRLFSFLVEKGCDTDGLGIMDGATVLASVDAGESTITASLFQDFLNQR